jgi:regulator of sigma E protease
LRCICVNLAIINLLPFPVLDGGHIMFALWEIVTRRKPNFKVVNALVNAFAILLIGLMLLLVYRDGRRLYSERQRQHNNDTKNEMPDIDTAPVVEEGVP